MPTTIEKTVREIALETPASIRVFESLGIDYCCGGRKPLSEACAEAGIAMDRALALLTQAAAAPQTGESDWSRASLAALAAHIVEAHHGYVRAETPRIQSLLAKVGSKHAVKRPELIRIERLFLALAQELATHMLKEEHILFPYVASLEEARAANSPAPHACFDSIERPIANMLADHDDAGALLAQMRALSHGYSVPEDACPTFVALYRALEEFERDLHMHVHLENNVLFPRAVALEQGR